jgi:hypothetical protein
MTNQASETIQNLAFNTMPTDRPLERFGVLQKKLALTGIKKKLATRILGGDPTPTQKQLAQWQNLFFEGDPLADAVVEMYDRLPAGQGHKLLLKALDEGIDQVADAPKELRALFQQVDEDPLWLNRDLLQRGAEVCHRAGMSADYFLRNGALMGGYQHEAITKPLIFTGSLGGKVTSVRRLVETEQFWLDVTQDRNLDRFDKGFKTSIQVRMMHALSRKKVANAKNWDSDKWGLPINQADMALTNFGFSVLLLIGLRLQGYIFTRKDSEAVMHLWRYVGFLIGIRDDLCPATEKEALRIAYAFAAYDNNPGPDQDSLELAQALRDMPLIGATTKKEIFLANQEMLYKAGFSRFFIGDVMSNALGVPKSIFWRIVPYVQPLIIVPIELLSFALPPFKKYWSELGRRRQEKNFNRDVNKLKKLTGQIKAESKFEAVETLTSRAG